MTYAEFLHLAEFNEIEQARLLSLACRFPDIEQYAKGYMSGESYKRAVELTESHATDEVSVWALDLVFVCHGYVLLWDKYREAGYTLEAFKGEADGLRIAVRSCITRYGDIGTFFVSWFERVFNMTMFTFGRLQFGIGIKASAHLDFTGADFYEKNGYRIERDDIVLDCHIPSGGSLTQEKCFDSYRRAWEKYKHLWSDGIMRASCATYLFYPPYQALFGKNTRLFAENFDLIHVQEADSFTDAWRFFDTNDISNLDVLPQNTSVQRNFINYIKNGGTFGRARGFLMFDGEKIVNK